MVVDTFFMFDEIMLKIIKTYFSKIDINLHCINSRGYNYKYYNGYFLFYSVNVRVY